MAERTLNNRQVEVLQWIADGRPAGVMDGFTHKTTAVALRSRRLVQIQKTRDSWNAVLTGAGKYFLDHGAYPDGHWPTYERANVTQRSSPEKSRPERSVTAVRPVAQLVADVIASGGELTIPSDEVSRYESLVSSAIRYGKLPEGKLLKVDRGTTWNDQIVRLTDKPEWMTTVLDPIPVAGTLRNLHPAIQNLRNGEFVIRAAVRSRAYRILDALAKEAERRGYGVQMTQGRGGERRSKGILTISVRSHDVGLDVDELNDRVPHVATATELRDVERYTWRTIPTHDLVPSGRLRIRVLAGWAIRQDAFADTKTIDLADRLPHVLQEVELRAHEAELRRIERERREAERQAQWERAVEKAKVAARDDSLGKILRDQVGRWEESKRMDTFLETMQDRLSEMSEEERLDAQTWLEWIRGYRDRLDPLNGHLAMPKEHEFTATELAPFMPGGRSSYGL